jgi:DUF1680 family protein
MLNITGKSSYRDAMETVLYNGVLPGISLDGKEFFYQNPLADRGVHRRSSWFETPCCPPNASRVLGTLGAYQYSTTHDEVWIHLYASGRASLALNDSDRMTLEQDTNYPWDGTVRIKIVQAPDRTTVVRLAIPTWCHGATVRVNGGTWGTAEAGTYHCLSRTWTRQDSIELKLPMDVRIVEAHPWIESTTGRVALMRGPLVYCFEQVDHPGNDVFDILVDPDAEWKIDYREELLGGISVISGMGYCTPTEGLGLYGFSGRAASLNTAPITLTAVPYFRWANREIGPMQVWTRAIRRSAHTVDISAPRT